MISCHWAFDSLELESTGCGLMEYQHDAKCSLASADKYSM